MGEEVTVRQREGKGRVHLPEKEAIGLGKGFLVGKGEVWQGPACREGKREERNRLRGEGLELANV